MCGQFTVDIEENDSIYRIITEAREAYPHEAVRTGIIRPSNTVAVIAKTEGKTCPVPMSWGLPKWTGKGLIINARSETVVEKPMFKKSFETMRCVIPSTGFYEWTHDEQKIKYRFRLPGETLLYMAGIYSVVEGAQRFVVITTAANESIADVHDRMPVVLLPDEAKAWMKNTSDAFALLQSRRPLLVRD